MKILFIHCTKTCRDVRVSR